MAAGRLRFASLPITSNMLQLDSLSTCVSSWNKFSDNFVVVFNAKKSKSLMFESTCIGLMVSYVKSLFLQRGNVIDVVNQWPHCGHIIGNRYSLIA